MRRSVKAVALIPVALLAAGCATGAATGTTHKAAPQPTITKIVTETPRAPIVVKPKIIVTVPPAQQAPAAPAGSLRDISPNPAVWHLWAGPSTSDAFAINVYQAWDGIPGVKYVYSPVTGQTYAMTFRVTGAGTVIATGGNGAYVQFSG